MMTMMTKILIIESVSFILNPYIVNTSAMLLFSDILIMIIWFGLMCSEDGRSVDGTDVVI